MGVQVTCAPTSHVLSHTFDAGICRGLGLPSIPSAKALSTGHRPARAADACSCADSGVGLGTLDLGTSAERLRGHLLQVPMHRGHRRVQVLADSQRRVLRQVHRHAELLLGEIHEVLRTLERELRRGDLRLRRNTSAFDALPDGELAARRSRTCVFWSLSA